MVIIKFNNNFILLCHYVPRTYARVLKITDAVSLKVMLKMWSIVTLINVKNSTNKIMTNSDKRSGHQRPNCWLANQQILLSIIIAHGPQGPSNLI